MGFIAPSMLLCWREKAVWVVDRRLLRSPRLPRRHHPRDRGVDGLAPPHAMRVLPPLIDHSGRCCQSLRRHGVRETFPERWARPACGRC